MQPKKSSWPLLLIVLLGAWVAVGTPGIPNLSIPTFNTKTTQATYVTDDRRSTPGPVSAGLQKLNAAGIMATVFEKGTTDGTGEVPDQYKIANGAASEIPALVIQAGEKVVKIVKAPKTEAETVEAAK